MTEPLQAARADKISGILLGAAVGDALGWPQEDRSQILGGAKSRNVEPALRFRSWQRYGGTQFAKYLDDVAAGQYSDDTQLLLAVARSCQRGTNWLSWLIDVELPQWPIYQRGGGGAVLRAARAWADGHPPWAMKGQNAKAVTRYYDAGANGAAMRIAPHAIVSRESIDKLTQRVLLDGLTTHGHPRALIGALLHAYALRHALNHDHTLGYGELVDILLDTPNWRDHRNLLDSVTSEWQDGYSRSGGEASLRDSWQQTVTEAEQLLMTARTGLDRGALTNDQNMLSDLGATASRWSGAGHVTAIAAVYIAARTATRPTGGLLRSAFLKKADTDTLCSMTGSLLGAVHGNGWLGALGRDVQDAHYLIRIGTELAQARDAATTASNSTSTPGPSPAAREVSGKVTRSWTQRLFEEGKGDALPDGRPFHVTSLTALPTKSKNVVSRATGITDDGQSFVIDRVSKRAPAAISHKPSTPPNVTSDAGNDSSAHPIEATTAPPTSKPPSTRTAAPSERHGSLVSIELSVTNLDAYRLMFEHALRATCEPQTDCVVVNRKLVLRRAENPNSATHGVRLNWSVPDLTRAREVLREQHPQFKVAASTDSKSLWIRDPHGNRIQLTQSNTGPAGTAHPT